MPRTIQTPETPQPVPISTTLLAVEQCGDEAQRRAAAGADRHGVDLCGPGASADSSTSSSAMNASEYDQTAGFEAGDDDGLLIVNRRRRTTGPSGSCRAYRQGH